MDEGKRKLMIDEGERFPMFFISDGKPSCGIPVEVDAETAHRWEAAFREFERVQDEMRDAYDRAEAARQSRTP